MFGFPSEIKEVGNNAYSVRGTPFIPISRRTMVIIAIKKVKMKQTLSVLLLADVKVVKLLLCPIFKCSFLDCFFWALLICWNFFLDGQLHSSLCRLLFDDGGH